MTMEKEGRCPHIMALNVIITSLLHQQLRKILIDLLNMCNVLVSEPLLFYMNILLHQKLSCDTITAQKHCSGTKEIKIPFAYECFDMNKNCPIL